MSDRTDDRLVEEHLSGSAHAFGELVRRYERRAANLAYRLLNNTEDAEEVCQEAFLRAYLKVGELRERGSFFPWFFSIVLNLCRERLRVRQRTAARVLVTALEAGPEAAAGQLPDRAAKDAWQGIEEEELRRRLDDALEALPVPYRQVIILRCFEGLSYTEMAHVLDCRKRTVRWRLYRARQMLRAALTGYA